MEQLKNLANCKPIEFLRQTNRIKKAVGKWLTINEIISIRKQMPKLDEAMTKQQREEAVRKQSMENLSMILDNCLDKHPEETLEVIALCCFVEPEDANNHPMGVYLKAIAEMIADESVISFFTSLARLEQTNFLTV